MQGFLRIAQKQGRIRMDAPRAGNESLRRPLRRTFRKNGAALQPARRDGIAADAEDQLMRETQSTSVPGAVTCRSSPSSARTLS